MDLTPLYLLAGFIVSALYFEFRVRRFMHKSAPMALERVLSAFLVKTVSKAEDGTNVESWALSVRGRAIVAAVTPALIAEVVAWARKNVKFTTGPGGVPAGGDLSQLLPQLLGGSGLFGGGKKGAFLGQVVGALVQQFLPQLLGKPGTKAGEMSEITKGLIP